MIAEVSGTMTELGPAAVSQSSRRHAVDVLIAEEAGRRSLSDPDLLASALVAERVLVSFDPDFLALHQSGVPHAGIA